MADLRVQDLGLYISTRKETSLNTDYTAGAGFYKAVTLQAIPFIYPQFSFISDAGRVGNANEFPTTFCPDYSLPITFTITDDINTAYAGNLWLRALGGAVTTAQQGVTTAYKHTAPLLAPSTSLQLPSTTCVFALGTASYRVPGCVVASYTISQQGTNRPQFSCTLTNTGKFTEPHGVTSLPTTISLLTCLDPHASVVSWTDTVGAQNFVTTLCELLAWSITVDNNLVTDGRCIGDASLSIVDGSLTTTPHYLSKLQYGNPRTITGSITVRTKSASIADWRTFATNDTITDLTLEGRGAIIASTFRHTLGAVLEKAHIDSITPGEDNGIATETINFSAVHDTVSGTPITGEVMNLTTANYD